MRKASTWVGAAAVGLFTIAACSGRPAPQATTAPGSQKGSAGQYYYVNLFSPPIGGIVSSDKGGINCGASAVGLTTASPPQYSYTYYTGASACGTGGQTRVAWSDTITLTATPRGTNAFLGWAGDCSGYDPCVLTPGADKGVVAIFGAAGSSHPNFTDPALHKPAYLNQTLNCTKCHGPTLQGQGIAPSCAECHTWPLGAGGANFSIGGTVSGLGSSGLVLRTAGELDLTVAAGAISFTFVNALATGTTYAVTVAQQPVLQTCTVTNGSGVVAEANVSGVAVNCTTTSCSAGQHPEGNACTADTRSCVVANGAGSQTWTTAGWGACAAVSCDAGYILQGASCAPVPTYTVGGSVSGLAGTGLILATAGQANTAVAAGATGFGFAGAVPSGTAYSVSVAQQPSSPSQVCTVQKGAGTVGGTNVTAVAVTCVTIQYRVTGAVTGLSGTGLLLRNNGSDDLLVLGSGTFTFPTRVASGAGYEVTVAQQPSSPNQTCAVSSGAGSIGSADVSSVEVSCVTNSYPVSGTVSGLSGSGLLVTASIDGGPAQDSPVTANGFFAFPLPGLAGSTFAVSVKSQPSTPWQTCTVSGGTGVLTGAVTGVSVACTTNHYTLAGSVAGLSGSGLVLATAGEPNLPVASGASAFTFASPLPSGSAYGVTVAQQPSSPSQVCSVTGGAGTVAGANLTGVAVTCTTNSFSVGGAVTGLVGSGLILRDNGGDDLLVTASGSFTFATRVASGTAYSVTVGQQPTGPAQACQVSGGTGVVGASNIASVSLNCRLGSFSPTGSMSTDRVSPTATRLADGTVLVLGGNRTTAEVYDPNAGTFSPTGSLNNVRYEHAATLLQNGKVLVVGGVYSYYTAELYNPATKTFTCVIG